MQAQVPQRVAEYFGDVSNLDRKDSHPTIEAAFRPGSGWVSQRSYRKRISVSWLRKMRAEGFTHVALRCGRRVADFSIAEVAR